MEVYLDNSATTAVFPQVADLMYKIMTEDYGNPSSMHQKGIVAEKYLRHDKRILQVSLKYRKKKSSLHQVEQNLIILRLSEAQWQENEEESILLQPILNILQFLKPSSSLKAKVLK